MAWSAVPNGRKGTANVFTLRANDIKRVPEPAEPDADDQEIVVGRCDMRGERAAVTNRLACLKKVGPPPRSVVQYYKE